MKSKKEVNMINKDVIKVGDSIMINIPQYGKTYIRSKFLKNGKDVRKVDVDIHQFGRNNLRCDYKGRWSKKIEGGYVVKVDGDKYLIGFESYYETYKVKGRDRIKTDEKGIPITFKKKHSYLPSFYREDNDCWEICEYGCWVDREDFFKLSGFTHLNRLIGKTKDEIDDYSKKIEEKTEWLKKLEGDLEKLELEVV